MIYGIILIDSELLIWNFQIFKFNFQHFINHNSTQLINSTEKQMQNLLPGKFGQAAASAQDAMKQQHDPNAG